MMDDASKSLVSHKIKTAAEIAALIGAPPRGKKVVMCHGTFDIVHPGHVRHLLYAKSKADMLVASLTADAHITKAQFPAVRSAGTARVQSRGARSRRLRRYRPDADADREHQGHQARLFRQGIRICEGWFAAAHRRGKERGRSLWRRNSLHAWRYRLFVVQYYRDRAASDCHREAAFAVAGGEAGFRYVFASRSASSRTSAFTWSATPSSTATPIRC